MSEAARNVPNSNLDEPPEFHLTPEGFGGYLMECGLIRDLNQISVRELGGGVSNIVLLVEGPEGRWVGKQSLGKLRVKDDWQSSRERIFREATAIERLASTLGDAAPQVVHVDWENFLYIMTAAPERSVMWKQFLLEGRVDQEIAEKAGELLARIIKASRTNPDFERQFDDRTVFDELRVDPYYRTVAARHPDAAELVQELIGDSWNLRNALVHGDYSPKNLLVREREVFLIDFEVVHWGDPSFDAAFLLNHLTLKAFYRPQDAGLYFQAARGFWRTLNSGHGEWVSPGFEPMTVRHLGGLMLARIDGKSPVEYLQDEGTKESVRKAAKHLLREHPCSVEEAFRFVENGIARK